MPAPAVLNLLYTLSVDRQSVHVWQPTDPAEPATGSWSTIGGPATHIYAGDFGMVATAPGTGNLNAYDFEHKAWHLIGGPGTEFAVTAEAVYGLNPGGVTRFNGRDWDKVGGPAAHIFGGRSGLVATNPTTGNVYLYPGGTSSDWGPPIGGPGATFAVTGDGVFGLTPDHQKITWYLGTPGQWKTVAQGPGDGGPFATIYGGGGLLAASQGSGDVHLFGSAWSKIGGPGAMFAVADTAVYGVTPAPDSEVVVYNGSGTAWTRLGMTASAIVAGHPGAFSS